MSAGTPRGIAKRRDLGRKYRHPEGRLDVFFLHQPLGLEYRRAVTASAAVLLLKVGPSISYMHHPCTNISEPTNDASEMGATGHRRPA